MPDKATDMLAWSWPQFEPHYAELAGRSLSAATVETFLSDWTRLHERLDEVGARLSVAKDANTADEEAEAGFNLFTETVYPRMQVVEQKLRARLLDSGLQPAGFDLPLRKMKTEAAIFRAANLPLQAEVAKLCTEYSKISGSQTVEWDGKEATVPQLRPVYQEPIRERRESAWRSATSRQLADRTAISGLWQQLLKLRLKVTANAGFSDYRSYRWRELLRFDYSPDDCKRFHQAIEQVVVPTATRIYERRRRTLGIESLRPWDLSVDPGGRPGLKPFAAVAQLRAGVRTMLDRVDEELGRHFQTMIDEELLDLDNRNNKAPGGYCIPFDAARRSFIFMNAVGVHRDVLTLIHESGHAFHNLKSAGLPYFQQRQGVFEFYEVASMGLELLAASYFAADRGGFYTTEEAERARTEKLEDVIRVWPHMAVVDAFQHWVYENPGSAFDPDSCDREWLALHQRFAPGVDWTGLEDVRSSMWQRQFQIVLMPFYYIEYGLAQLGACQVWANALKDRAAAVAAYKRALALGGTRSLPDLFAAAGARFAFDAEALRSTVGLIEEKLAGQVGRSPGTHW